jgi:hypothetical protein
MDSNQRRGESMSEMSCWETPSFEVLRMDAEVGSYQEDFDPGRDPPPLLREDGGS